MQILTRIARAAAVVAVVLGVSASAAHARQLDHFTDSFDVSFVVGGMCGDMDVRIHAAGGFKVLGRETGPDRLHRYTVVHHGYESFTNLTTGKAITSDFDYVVQDVGVTDNDDGTFTIRWQTPGAQRWFGPDGHVVVIDSRPSWYETVIDMAGTPDDPSDDTLVSKELIRVVAAHVDEDFCDVFRAVTA